MRRIGIFGGTFDPVHLGHLRPALEILDALSLDQVRFIPTGMPPHRNMPVASAVLRLAMLKAALADESRFHVDEREITRTQPCYTVDTLAELRREYPGAALSLIVGMDAFLGFPAWHQWQRLFELAHVVVAHRPGWTFRNEGVLGEVVTPRLSASATELTRVESGCVLLQPVTQLEISATLVRDCIAAGRDPRYLVPAAVRDILIESKCYAKR
ncbi:MAG TPA: nicotinate-nucleotide adenylyltransferase [Gammaproteobacteria bacterium]|nr:nicotinate-nucleotide adenylyltransferase [Gammaproteobacteria bacterium]